MNDEEADPVLDCWVNNIDGSGNRVNVNAYDSESRNSGDAEGQARVRIPME